MKLGISIIPLEGTPPFKGKVVPVLFLTEYHAMAAYLGSESIVPLIL
jgi:hypothetical protein